MVYWLAQQFLKFRLLQTSHVRSCSRKGVAAKVLMIHGCRDWSPVKRSSPLRKQSRLLMCGCRPIERTTLMNLVRSVQSMVLSQDLNCMEKEKCVIASLTLGLTLELRGLSLGLRLQILVLNQQSWLSTVVMRQRLCLLAKGNQIISMPVHSLPTHVATSEIRLYASSLLMRYQHLHINICTSERTHL